MHKRNADRTHHYCGVQFHRAHRRRLPGLLPGPYKRTGTQDEADLDHCFQDDHRKLPSRLYSRGLLCRRAAIRQRVLVRQLFHLRHKEAEGRVLQHGLCWQFDGDVWFRQHQQCLLFRCRHHPLSSSHPRYRRLGKLLGLLRRGHRRPSAEVRFLRKLVQHASTVRCLLYSKGVRLLWHRVLERVLLWNLGNDAVGCFGSRQRMQYAVLGQRYRLLWRIFEAADLLCPDEHECHHEQFKHVQQQLLLDLDHRQE